MSVFLLEEDSGGSIRNMKRDVVEIPVSVLASVETLDELEDWLMAQNPKIMAALMEARQQDLNGEFRAWRPQYC